MTDNKSDFEKHYRQHSLEVQNFVSKYVGNISTAEDITHEVFLRVQKSVNWKDIDKPRAYLFAAARNQLIDHFRRQSSQRRKDTVEFDEFVHDVSGISEEKRIETRDSLRKLTEVIKNLSPRVQRAFILSRIYKYSYGEVGKIMDISPRTVENHVAKGLLACTTYMVKINKQSAFPLGHNVTTLDSHRKKSAK